MEIEKPDETKIVCLRSKNTTERFMSCREDKSVPMTIVFCKTVKMQTIKLLKSCDPATPGDLSNHLLIFLT